SLRHPGSPAGGPGLRPLLALFALTTLAAAAPAHAGPDDASFDDVVKPFLQRNCYLCHGARLKNADVDLQAFETPAAIVADPEVWEKAVMKMRTGQMPPPPVQRPEEAEIAAVTGWIENTIDRAVRSRPPDPGR